MNLGDNMTKHPEETVCGKYSFNSRNTVQCEDDQEGKFWDTIEERV